jgi:hypothetical protein
MKLLRIETTNMIPSEDWLKKINEKLRRKDVHPKARPFLAIDEFQRNLIIKK